MSSDDGEAELNAHLEKGSRLARAMVDYFLTTGAAKIIIPIHVNDEKYAVVVKHIPVKPEEG